MSYISNGLLYDVIQSEKVYIEEPRLKSYHIEIFAIKNHKTCKAWLQVVWSQ